MGMEFDDEMFPIPRMVTISGKKVVEIIACANDDLYLNDDLYPIFSASIYKHSYIFFSYFIPELKEVIEKLVLERDNLASQVDDLKQVTEAAKRERVLAIDEKDHLLRE